MRREHRTTTKSNPIAGRPSPCSSPRTAATTARADICRPQGQKTKFESCVTDVVKITETGLKITELKSFRLATRSRKNALVELSVATPVRTMIPARPPALVSWEEKGRPVNRRQPSSLEMQRTALDEK